MSESTPRTDAAVFCDGVEGCDPQYIAPDFARALERELNAVRLELEREQMRLAACGVVAMSDTPESAKMARDMHPDYESASCNDVARRVDECIRLRATNTELLEALREFQRIAYAGGSRAEMNAARKKADAAIAGAMEKPVTEGRRDSAHSIR